MHFLDDLIVLQKQINEVCGVNCTAPVADVESAEYHACSFKIAGRLVLYRQAKITPTKTGQFVTIWKRKNVKAPIQPYDSADNVSLFVVSVKTKTKHGLFVFTKDILIKKGVFSVNNKGGKRAIRVYPPWDKANSKQAQTSQKWQLEFFVEISKNKAVNEQKFKALLADADLIWLNK